MRAAVLMMALAAGVASGQVVDCPQTHQGAPLLGASMYEGAQKEHELIGDRKEVRGGQDARFQFNGGEVKWVACWYKPAKPVWYQVSIAAKRCDLRERTGAGAGGKVLAKVACE